MHRAHRESPASTERLRRVLTKKLLVPGVALVVVAAIGLSLGDRAVTTLKTRGAAFPPEVSLPLLPVPEIGDPQHCPSVLELRTDAGERASAELAAFLQRSSDQPDAAGDLWVSFSSPKQQDELALPEDLELDGATVIYPYTSDTVFKADYAKLPVYPDLDVPPGLPTGHVSEPLVSAQAQLIRLFREDLERPHGPEDRAVLESNLRRAEAGDLPLAVVRIRGTWRELRAYVAATQAGLYAVSTNSSRIPPFPEEPSSTRRAIEICEETTSGTPGLESAED